MPEGKKIKLFIVVNEDRFFLSHRKEIAQGAKKEGYDVTIVGKNTGRRSEIEGMGLRFIDLVVNPTGMNVFEELRTLHFLYNLYRREKPDLVHHVGVKVILWGGVAARLAGVPAVLNAVSGLGVVFSIDEKPTLLRSCIMAAFRFAHHRKHVLDLFQNNEDRDLFYTHDIADPLNTRFIKGSGVDLDKFWSTPEPDSTPLKIVFPGRMVREKGVVILAEAAERLRERYEGKIEFLLCGDITPNPNALSQEDMARITDGKYIKWLGFCSNIDEIMRQSHIVVFPSYYREGVPKSLIDACAIGRPIVTTDSTGCRDTVEDGWNGILVPIKNSRAVADAIATLVENKEMRLRLGRHSRRKAEREFSVKSVVQKHLSIYAELLNDK